MRSRDEAKALLFDDKGLDREGSMPRNGRGDKLYVTLRLVTYQPHPLFEYDPKRDHSGERILKYIREGRTPVKQCELQTFEISFSDHYPVCLS